MAMDPRVYWNTRNPPGIYNQTKTTLMEPDIAENEEWEGYAPSIFEKLVEPLNAYTICKLKIQQLCSQLEYVTNEQLDMLQQWQEDATFHAKEIQKTLPNFFDNQ